MKKVLFYYYYFYLETTVQNSSFTKAQAKDQIDPKNPRNEKNWDKIVKSAVKELAPDSEKDNDFYDDDIDDGDPMNKFFKQIYRNGTDDQRRAMMKSFQESGGTVLSTNWEECANKRVEPQDKDSVTNKLKMNANK